MVSPQESVKNCPPNGRKFYNIYLWGCLGPVWYDCIVCMLWLVISTSVIVTVSLSSHRKHDFDNFETYIKDIDTVTECIATGGGTDYIMKVITPNLESFQELMNELISTDLKIDRYMTYIITKEIKSSHPNLSKLIPIK